MEKLYSLNALSHEAREFALNTLNASKNFYRLIIISATSGVYLLSNILRLLFLKPKLILKRGPNLFEEVESMRPGAPNPFASPPGRMF